MSTKSKPRLVRFIDCIPNGWEFLELVKMFGFFLAVGAAYVCLYLIPFRWIARLVSGVELNSAGLVVVSSFAFLFGYVGVGWITLAFLTLRRAWINSAEKEMP